jgi:serine/threonine protein kinase
VKQQRAAVSQARTLDGRYRLEGEIGSGGLGVVYRAEHEKLAKPVAIKLLHAHCGGDPVLRARFEREAKALAALDHPNIVRVTDYGVEGDTPYLVMELLEGQSLAERMALGALDEANAHELALPLLSALAYVHAAGLVHRDVKPGNVFLQRTKDGSERLKLLDFGLAKFTLGTLEDASVTRSGAVLGTPAYMSPEQASGRSHALQRRRDRSAARSSAGRCAAPGRAASRAARASRARRVHSTRARQASE